MDLKDLFGSQSLTYDDFIKLANEKNAKIVDLSDGGYVDKHKYNDEVKKLKATADKLQKDYDDLCASVNGDEGYEKRLEQIQQQLDDYKGKYESASKELDSIGKLSKVAEAGISKEYQKFVLSEVNSLVTEELSFEDALKGYAEQNKHFCTGIKTKKNTSNSLEGNGDSGEFDDKFFEGVKKGAGLQD